LGNSLDLTRESGLQYNGRDNAAGAQTERRGGAGPVRGLLGGKDRTGRFIRGSEVSRHLSPQPLAVRQIILVRAR